MKKYLFLIFALVVVNQCFAQWISEGNNRLYTLSMLAESAPDAVSAVDDGSYTISQDITISQTDTLLLENSASSIQVNPSIKILVNGTLQTENRNTTLNIIGDSQPDNHFSVTFDSASANVIENVKISECYRILMINSDVIFKKCEFLNFSNHVISYMNCNPLIQDCFFHDNAACAIQSAVNTDGCPKIINNRFFSNVTSNSNNPQINIGPGTSDTIVISGNLIEGLNSDKSGGIGIANLYNPGVTNVILKDNIIKNNRYGYTQNGYRISSQIINNQIIDNYLETIPNNGGSGISIYGYDQSNAAKLRNNLITGNLWGVTAIYYNDIDMGTEDDFGYNVIYDNWNSGKEYELFNNSNSDISAVGNYWGHDNADQVENVIYHKTDSAIYGMVNYLPIYVIEPSITSFSLLKEDNPCLESDVFGSFSAENDTIFLHIVELSSSAITNLKPRITVPYGVMTDPDGAESINFENPFVITASTPHQTTKGYVVVADFALSVNNHEESGFNIFPNPIVSNSFMVESSKIKDYVWTIYSMDGKTELSGVVKPGSNNIDVAKISSGVYILEIKDGKESYTNKIIIK